MNKYIDQVFIESMNEMDIDDSISEDDDGFSIDAVMNDAYGESVIDEDEIQHIF